MPVHVAPHFRNREVAMEAAGLIVPLNSDGYNQKVALENAGLSPKTIPVELIFNFNGKQIKAKE